MVQGYLALLSVAWVFAATMNAEAAGSAEQTLILAQNPDFKPDLDVYRKPPPLPPSKESILLSRGVGVTDKHGRLALSESSAKILAPLNVGVAAGDVIVIKRLAVPGTGPYVSCEATMEIGPTRINLGMRLNLNVRDRRGNPDILSGGLDYADLTNPYAPRPKWTGWSKGNEALGRNMMRVCQALVIGNTGKLAFE